MEVRNRAMCQLVYYAADSVDAGFSRSHLDCALMKRAVPRMATEVASEALQILGGRGYTDRPAWGASGWTAAATGSARAPTR